MEDTNPDKIDPDAYEMIPEDLEWMGVKVHQTVIQSDRFELYYDIARQLIEKGQAYVCTCPVEEWRKMKEESRPCPHRDLPKEVQLEHVGQDARRRTSRRRRRSSWSRPTCKHPNPAIRDFVGLRIVTARRTPAPAPGTASIPMMNFCVAVDDHFLGLTHVIRGKDHLNNTLRQEYMFNYFGWKMPWYHHYGLVSIPDAILKTSTVGKGIKTGEYTGWDDVRLGTVRAMGKRGIRPEAIRAFWVDCGIKEVDIEFSWDTLYAYNRDIVDTVADRYFVRVGPATFGRLRRGPAGIHSPVASGSPGEGRAESRVEGRARSRCTSSRPTCKPRSEASSSSRTCATSSWSHGKGKYIGNDLAILKEKVKIIHWVPDYSPASEVLMPDGTRRKVTPRPCPSSRSTR